MREVNDVVARMFDYAVDHERTLAFKAWIKDNVNGKVVCELGTGSGIMAQLCLNYGATKVYAYENNKRMIAYLKEQLSAQIDEGKIVLVEEDISTATFPTADIYLHENIGSNVYMENILAMYENLKSQGLEDKTYPNKIKIQYGTYTGNSTLHELDLDTNFPHDESVTIEGDEYTFCYAKTYIQNSYNWDAIKRKLNKLKEVDQSTVTIEGTAFDGDFKDLTQDLPAAVVGKYIFWEASFDGSHTLSNWKNKTSWNVIGPENAYLAIGVDTTYTVGAE